MYELGKRGIRVGNAMSAGHMGTNAETSAETLSQQADLAQARRKEAAAPPKQKHSRQSETTVGKPFAWGE